LVCVVHNVRAEATELSDPTAGYVWPSSRLLADFLQAGLGTDLGPTLAGKRVLELGAAARARAGLCVRAAGAQRE